MCYRLQVGENPNDSKRCIRVFSHPYSGFLPPIFGFSPTHIRVFSHRHTPAALEPQGLPGLRKGFKGFKGFKVYYEVKITSFSKGKKTPPAGGSERLDCGLRAAPQKTEKYRKKASPHKPECSGLFDTGFLSA